MNTKLRVSAAFCDTLTPATKLRRSLSFLGLLTLVGMSLGSLPAYAVDVNEGSVDVGGEHVLTIYFPSGSMSVKDRADKVTERLVTILGDPKIAPSDVQALAFGAKEARIMVKDKLLYTVDMQTAKRNSTTPMKLAQTYVTHLRALLPKINVKPNPNEGAPADGG